MKYDQLAIQNMQRLAFAMLTTPTQVVKNANGISEEIKNKWYVKPEAVTEPMHLVTEVPFTNAQNEFTFDYSINQSPAGTAGGAGTNNVVLGKNNIAVIYGYQLLIGEGANPANRIYRSFGVTVNDNCIYNSTLSLKTETSTFIDKVNGQNFRDVPAVPTEFDANAGMLLTNPLRFVTGELGIFQATIKILNPINNLVLTPNLFLSLRPLCCYGQATGVK